MKEEAVWVKRKKRQMAGHDEEKNILREGVSWDRDSTRGKKPSLEIRDLLAKNISPHISMFIC